MTEFPLEKLNELQELARIPHNDGEQFISVYLNLTWGNAGHITYGFNWKCEMGEVDFKTLDQAIETVKELRKRAKL